MSLLPNFPSPALTSDTPHQIIIEEDQSSLRKDVESLLLRLSQDLYEMEICAGDVNKGMEDAVPNYLLVSLLIISLLRKVDES
jgi:mediator of RNA polymerase II transcription subunit 10